MRDLISRQASIDAVNGVLSHYIPLFRNDQEGIPLECARAIMKLPSVQPRKGKWAGKGDSEGFGIFICDNCGKFAMMEYDFCPNCGADMREGDAE